ncbi:hypothetical protein VNO80_10118 [Phaseolus coccineus]|uniref:Uncharacterized protein n=1 Tax=Phaseolus coccineus TaxID=3886 RepID=A0AAN9N9A5_PHACN
MCKVVSSKSIDDVLDLVSEEITKKAKEVVDALTHARLLEVVLENLPPLDMHRKHKKKGKSSCESRGEKSSSICSPKWSQHGLGGSSTPLLVALDPHNFLYQRFREDLKKGVPPVKVEKLKKELLDSGHSLQVVIDAYLHWVAI